MSQWERLDMKLALPPQDRTHHQCWKDTFRLVQCSFYPYTSFAEIGILCSLLPPNYAYYQKHQRLLLNASYWTRRVHQTSHLSASKVQWPELSQLSLCSEFDKENSMEFLLNSLLLIHFTTVAMRLLSHGPHATLVMWHTVTIRHTIVTLWQSHMILFCTPSSSCKSNKKRKEKKRNINNNLAVLPSHDIIAEENINKIYFIYKNPTTKSLLK